MIGVEQTNMKIASHSRGDEEGQGEEVSASKSINFTEITYIIIQNKGQYYGKTLCDFIRK